MSTSLELTPAELAAGRMSEASLANALRALNEDGFLVLENVVDRAHLAVLRDRMLEDLPLVLAREDVPFNFHPGNVQQDAPPFPPYLFRDVLVNELVIQVTRAILGPGVKNAYYSGNTALPGDYWQPVHPDVAQLWPGLPHATPAFGFVVNVPTVDMTAENGSTQLWPGTHLDTTYTFDQAQVRVPEDRLAHRRAIRPPLQPAVPCGGVLIRDIRLWHAGMPNRTATPRPMIAMIHWCSWIDGSVYLPSFPRGTEAFFEHPELKTAARFVDGPIDYIHHNEAYDYAP
jgi:ectoine hydroxylase-related dioxygenase (phytanoyl-CoA dioxygenase family)